MYEIRQEEPTQHDLASDGSEPLLAPHETPPDHPLPFTIPLSLSEPEPLPPSALLRFLDIASLLQLHMPLPQTCAAIITHVTKHLPAFQGGILWLVSQDTNTLSVGAIAGLPLDPMTQHGLSAVVLSEGESLAGVVLRQPEPIRHLVIDGYPSTHPNRGYQRVFEQFARELPQSLLILCLPLHIETQLMGVLELFSISSPDDSASSMNISTASLTQLPLIHLLQTFGRMAAAIIHNSQLYEASEHRCRRLDAFDAVVTAISTATDLPDLMGSVLDVIMGLLPVSASAVLLLDPSHARLTLGAHRNIPCDYLEPLRSLSVANAPCEEAVRYGQPSLRLLIDERGESPLIAVGFESCAYMPLLAGGTVVGVLALYGDATLPKRLDMSRLMPLGNQFGFAIANVRMYEDSQLERRKLNTVINSITEGVVLYDRTGRLVLANEAALELLSLDLDTFRQPLSDTSDIYTVRTLDGEPVAVAQMPSSRALAGEVFRDYRLLLRDRDGTDTVISFSGAPAHSDDESIEGAVVIFRDITASQKLERAKDEFLAVAAHELRSPLAAVRSYADMLLRRRERQRTDTDSQDMRGLTILSQQVTHMLRMVDNLLDVSRLDAGQIGLQIQSTELVSLTTEVLDQQRPSSKKHELILETDAPEIWVECDMLRIRQVLTNLVSNAIKYSPPEQPVVVSLRCEGVPDSSSSQSSIPPPQTVLLTVRDYGSGISPEQQETIFNRFYRATSTRRGDGLGLGLYLSRQFVQMHGGTIQVESSPGEGSLFSVRLPVAQTQEMMLGS